MDFRLLTVADKPLVDAALEKYPPEISELTFTNLFCWQGRRRIRINQKSEFRDQNAELGKWSRTQANGQDRIGVEDSRGPVAATTGAEGLVLLCEEEGRRFFLPPVCSCDTVSAVRARFEHARAAGFEPVMERVPEEMAKELKRAGLAAAAPVGQFRVEEDRANWDYVYRVSDLALLEGGHYDGKRNFIKQALEKYRCEYRQITVENVSDCLALETSWCNLRHCDMDPGLAAEQRAIAACFENWERFSLIGGAVVVDGKIEAFAVGERLNHATAVVHFEKANPELRGMYQLINQWFCRKELSAYQFVNREQDLGLDGLRKAKESYHPHHMVRKFIVRA
jgi:uncharacterized protein